MNDHLDRKFNIACVLFALNPFISLAIGSITGEGYPVAMVCFLIAILVNNPFTYIFIRNYFLYRPAMKFQEKNEQYQFLFSNNIYFHRIPDNEILNIKPDLEFLKIVQNLKSVKDKEIELFLEYLKISIDKNFKISKRQGSNMSFHINVNEDEFKAIKDNICVKMYLLFNEKIKIETNLQKLYADDIEKKWFLRKLNWEDPLKKKYRYIVEIEQEVAYLKYLEAHFLMKQAKKQYMDLYLKIKERTPDFVCKNFKNLMDKYFEHDKEMLRYNTQKVFEDNTSEINELREQFLSVYKDIADNYSVDLIK